MADNKALIKDAEDAVKLLSQYPKLTKDQAQKIGTYFATRKFLFRQIRDEITSCGKDADAYDKQIAAAEKTLKDLTKAKADDKLAGKLEDAIKDAKGAVKTFRVSLGEYTKFVDKADDDDSELAKVLTGILGMGGDIADKIGEYVITMPGEIESLDVSDQKTKNPKEKAQAIKQTLNIVSNRAKEIGADITTAQSVLDSIEGALKDRSKKAFLQTTDAMCDKAEKLEKSLEGNLKKCRSLLKDLIVAIKTYSEWVKQLAPA